MTDSSQKFIARNRAPRVQIEYDVELYGSEKKVQLPFVMGVMSDLSGKSTVAQPSIDDRKFLEIDVDNFDDRMRAMQPRASFSVPNTLTSEGNLEVDLTFEKMEDFSPQAIAAKIAPLRSLLEARTQLSNLMTYMDGKVGAETLIEKILVNPALLSALAESSQDDTISAAALDSLRALTTDEPQEVSATDSVLDGLKSIAPIDDTTKDTSADVLAALSLTADQGPEQADSKADVLSGLREQAPTGMPDQDDPQAALHDLRAKSAPEKAPDTSVDDALAGLAESGPDEDVVPDATAAALDSLAGSEVPTAPTDQNDALLADLAANAPEQTPKTDNVGAALESLGKVELEVPAEDGVDDALADLAANVPDEAPETDEVSAALGSVASVEPETPVGNEAEDALASLAAATPDEAPEMDELGAALDSLPDVDLHTPSNDTSDETLAGLAVHAPQDAPDTDSVEDALGSLADIQTQPQAGETTDDALAGLADMAPQESPQTDDVASALDSLSDIDETPPLEDNTTDTLAGLADATPDEVSDENDLSDALDSLASVEVEDAIADGDKDVLTELANVQPEEPAQADDLDLALDSLDADAHASAELDDLLDLGDLDTAPDAPEAGVDPAEPDDLDDLLGDLGETEPAKPDPQQTDPLIDVDAADLDDLLGDSREHATHDSPTPVEEPLVENVPEENPVEDLDDLLGDLDEPDVSQAGDIDNEAAPSDILGDLSADPEESDTPVGVTQSAEPHGGSEEDDLSTDDLDDLLADLDEPDVPETAASVAEQAPTDDLDDLLGDLNEPAASEPAAPDVDLDELLGEPPVASIADDAVPAGEPEFAYGLMTGARPNAEQLNRKRFRIALMGDFSGRAARGHLETGDTLAEREAILLDPDTVEEVIENFGTTLVLPIGKEGAGVEVKLSELDDLHPDELYEKVPILSDLQGLRSQLANGSTAANAAQRLKSWGETYGTPVAPPKARSGGNAVPANLKLSEFQQLIGDTRAELTTASPVDDMIAQIVGPHVRAVADADTVAMQKAVDEALSSAMRLILHHPEFQSIEAQWRSLDLIARSIEVDDTLEVILYDISAEEIGADLAAAEDLTQSGIVRLLTEAPLDPELGRGGYSAIIGLYTFEETPPHAELLGRIARVAAHVDAPFLAALSPTFMGTAKEDRHPLVATAWDTLRTMPEAGYLGLVAPRFLLRRPYGAKSEPIFEFDFEEFTMEAGLRGMLWANPVVLVAILLAKSYKENGAHLGLGSIMSLGDMPYHFVVDQYGDQVALPCTERNLTLEKVEKVMARGVMPVVSIKGRDEIRLASFQSLAGGDILGPWSDVPPPPPSPPKPAPAAAPEPAADTEEGGDDLGLDDLLAGFDDAATPDSDPGDVDADLAALLEDL